MNQDNLYFCLWYGPQYRFGYGVMTQRQVSVDWLEKVGFCDLKFTSSRAMFHEVAQHQGFNVEGLALTIIDEEMYQDTMRSLHNRFPDNQLRGASWFIK